MIDGTELAGLDDEELTALRRDKLGFVFQFFNLLPVLTAEENILLPLTIAGREPDREWLEQLIEIVGLGDRRTHRPAELSGGQQQRVAVARALASKPAVVFADEPTGNLDSKASDEVLALLRRAVSEFGQTVIMVTHEVARGGVRGPRSWCSATAGWPTTGRAPPRQEILELMKDGGVVLRCCASRSRGSPRASCARPAPSLAVFLGVALMAGTYILTDTINRSFDDIFTTALKGTDVMVTPREIVKQETVEPPPSRRIGARHGACDGGGRAAAEGGIFSFVRIVDGTGTGWVTEFAPNFVSSPARSRSRR